MPIQNLNIAYTGTGKQAPAIQMWDCCENNISQILLSRFPRGYSVYETAISPQGTRVAAGTRTGFLRVHSLTNYRGIEDCPAVFETYHMPSVDSLAFSTESILASGGQKGIIKLWSLVEKRQVGEIIAHPGGVLAMCSLGSLMLASIGADCRMRVWDLDSLEQVHESEVFPLPKLAALTSLDYNPTNGLLMHPSQTGHICIYNVKDSFKKTTVKAHDCGFVAICSGQKGIITGGLEDSKICLWSSDMQKMLASSSVSAGIITAAWAGNEYVLTGLQNGAVLIWRVQDNQLCSQKIYASDIRSSVGLPMKAVTEKSILEENQWRDSKITEARSIIPPSDPNSMHQFTSIIENLNNHGFSLESSLLMAEAAKQMNRPLWELELRLKQIEALGDNELSLPCRYALAELLEKMNESKTALSQFEKIIEIQPDYKDTELRIDKLKRHPLIDNCDNNYVRADIVPIETLSQEIEKYKILDRKFEHRVIYGKDRNIHIKLDAEFAEIFDCVRDALLKSANNCGEIHSERINILEPNRFRKAHWICVSNKDAFPGLAFGLEVLITAPTIQFNGYAVFDPDKVDTSKTDSAFQYDDFISNAWSRLQTDSVDANEWLKSTNNIALKAIQRLANSRQKYHSPF